VKSTQTKQLKQLPASNELGRKIGYARVSRENQNLDLQINALQAAGCEIIFQEKICSVAHTRPEFEKALNELKPNDTFIVWKLDRMGRSTINLLECISLINEKQAHFQSLTESLNTSSPMGTMIFTLFAAIAQYERELIRERTIEGLAAYKERGGVLGRRQGTCRMIGDKDDEDIMAWTKSGLSARAIAERLGVSRMTINRHRKELMEKAKPNITNPSLT
jgi:DNA invertase Pin-like site-specific DNA recombinase